MDAPLRDLFPAPEPVPEKNEDRTRRRRLWEVPKGYHCSIVGTCLSLERARRILRKTAGEPPGKKTDYSAHGAAVALAQTEGHGARLIEKALDRAHAASLRRYAKLRTDIELREAWIEDVRRGAIPGAYWAVVSHPAASLALLAEVFGDVHMLSHRVGRLNRERLRRFDEVLARADALEAKLGEEKRARRSEREESERARAALEAELDAARRTIEALSVAHPERLRALEETKAKQARLLSKTERRLENALGALDALRTEADVARRESEARRRELEAARALGPGPREASAGPGPREASAETPDPCEGCDLRGTVILYVGGERAMLPHLRRMARAANSELLHHDGGLEDGLGSLPRLCARADAVLCPVDRVGHVAMSEVKKACAREEKAFIPLRRSSLDAFGRGLEALSRPEDSRSA